MIAYDCSDEWGTCPDSPSLRFAASLKPTVKTLQWINAQKTFHQLIDQIRPLANH